MSNLQRDFSILEKAPFKLGNEALAWVRETMAGMTEKEKLAQLFCINVRRGDEEEFQKLKQVYGGVPGGVMYRPMSAEKAVNFYNTMLSEASIPPLVAANLEKGGNGIVTEGTTFGAPMEVAATDSVEMAEKLAYVCAAEAAAVGANWAFAPIIDIDYEFRNPITNTRTFGSDPDRVAKMGAAYTRVVQEMGLAASIKHFPGDGSDERDQHLVTSVNPLSCEKWDETYGMVYRAGIEAGALTCMGGHIMQPAWSKRLNPDLEDNEILPGSLSKELMEGLLRGHLGFNGMIVTDATTMAGYTIPMPRRLAVPTSIAAGADMFLFSKNMEEDYSFMVEGYRNGIISPERLDEAVMRILGVKAALGLHTKKEPKKVEEALAAIGRPEYHAWAKECADQAITLVKEEKGVLPLQSGKRVLFIPIEAEAGFQYSAKVGVCADIKNRLEAEGMVIDVFDPGKGEEGRLQPTTSIVGKYDYIIYIGNLVTKSNQTVVRIEWAQPMGVNCPQFLSQVPTIFISVENPYHLLDVPRIRTFINCYNSNDAVLECLMDKLMGRSPFKGKSPVDAFCGRWDTHLM